MAGTSSLFVRTCILLAVLVRLVPGTVETMLRAVDPLGGVTICHVESDETTPVGSDNRSLHDCALCPVCLTASLPLLTPTVGQQPVRTVAVLASATATPPATGPPASRFVAARPRGPPV